MAKNVKPRATGAGNTGTVSAGNIAILNTVIKDITACYKQLTRIEGTMTKFLAAYRGSATARPGGATTKNAGGARSGTAQRTRASRGRGAGAAANAAAA